MKSQFKHAILALPEPLRSALLELIAGKALFSMLKAKQVATLQLQTGLSERELAEALLPIAATFAVVPISDFAVGAISHGKSGNWYFGANQEFINLGLNQTIHAEQSAIVNAWNYDEREITTLTVNYSPCGHCRQFINELHNSENLQIQLPNRPTMTLHDYLPDAFGPSCLGKTVALLNHPLQSGETNGDRLQQAAKIAAYRSYAPYSGSYSGVALRMTDNQLICGSYAENAAFNPSVAPLQAALINLNLAGFDTDDIVEVVLAQSEGNKVSQTTACDALLTALGCPAVKTVSI